MDRFMHAEISMACIWICNISFLNSKNSFKACLLHASNQILHGICIHIRKWWRLFFPWWWWDSDKQSIGMNKKWSDDTKLRLIFRLSKYWHTLLVYFISYLEQARFLPLVNQTGENRSKLNAFVSFNFRKQFLLSPLAILFAFFCKQSQLTLE